MKTKIFLIVLISILLLSCSDVIKEKEDFIDNVLDIEERQNNEPLREPDQPGLNIPKTGDVTREEYKKIQQMQTSVGLTDPNRVVLPIKIPLQPINKPFKDTPFGTTLTRIGEAAREVDDQGVLHWERHIYSQLQPFNLDNSVVMLNRNNIMTFRELNNEFKIVYEFPNVINTPRWNPINPNEVYHFGFENFKVSLLKTNIRTGQTETVMSYPEKYVNIDATVSAEELSRDGKWITAYLFDKDDNGYFIAYDLINKKFGVQLGEQTQLFGSGVCGQIQDQNNPDEFGGFDAGPNWVRASPLGNMVIAWNRPGNERCRGIEVLDIETGEYIGHVGDRGSHSDVGLDKDGKEVYTAFYDGYIGATTFPGATSPNTFEPNLEKPYFKVLLNPGYGHTWHLSCQGPQGVCVVTAEPERSGDPFDDEIYLVDLDSNVPLGDNSQAKVRRLAHTRLDDTSCEVDGEFNYRMQPQASISSDGSFVIFASNWGKCGDASYSYLIDLRK